MKFRLDRMKDIKQGEIPEMKSIINIIKNRDRPHYSIKDKLTDDINIISELKHSSPSAGNLSGNLDDDKIVQGYINGGASAISVLAEKNFFNGSYGQLQTVGSYCSRPLLCKDFVFNDEQIEAAYLCGADAVLLISKILEKELLKKLYDKIKSFNMTPLVEIHSHEEIENIMFLNPELVLVNMRNLSTLEIDLGTGIETLSRLPSSVTRISASGISSKDDIRFIMDETGTNNFLIGSSLMKSGDPEGMLRELKNVY